MGVDGGRVADALADPVLNGPFDSPSRYFELGPKGPTGMILAGRRPSESLIPVPQIRKRGRKPTAAVQDTLDFDLTHERVEKNTLINDLRKAVDQDRTASEVAAPTAGDAPTFEQTILENLRRAGVQNGRTAERIMFASLDPQAGEYVQAVGDGISGGASLRVGVSIGPQYGIVSPGFITDAAKEAIRAGDVDLLCVLAFAFDPRPTGVTLEDGVTVETGDAGFAQVAGERQLGRVKVLLVRMNVDLLMGEELKKTGAGNLSTVFGEPDIDVRATDDDQVVVEPHGVDVYDPTTGEVRSHDTGPIALWMIDTDYSEEWFFVRHRYFTGGGDLDKRLKTALKAEIDADAWASLNSTVSRPFPRPPEGKIALKVINDYGDEVMKVFEVE